MDVERSDQTSTSSHESQENSNIDTLFRLMWDHEWDLTLEFIRQHEELAKEEFEDGGLPLHYACFFKAPRELVEYLLRIHPDAASSQDNDGSTPLHSLYLEYEECENDESKDCKVDELARIMIKAYPDAARTEDDMGLFPLYWAAINEKLPQSSFLRLVDAFPSAACYTEHNGDLPLHTVCTRLFKRDDEENRCFMITKLLEANLNAVFFRGHHDQMALHKIVMHSWDHLNKEKLDAIKIISNANPNAASDPDEEGDLPLHKICQRASVTSPNDHHLELLSLLFQANPRAASTPNNKGHLPFHLACIHWSTTCTKLLTSLLGANPEAIHIADNEGLTPLSLAMKRQSDSQEFVQHLFSLSASGAILSQLEQMTVAFAGSMVENKSLKERIRTLEKESTDAIRSAKRPKTNDEDTH